MVTMPQISVRYNYEVCTLGRLRMVQWNILGIWDTEVTQVTSAGGWMVVC
jgi:hypothetical protein